MAAASFFDDLFSNLQNESSFPKIRAFINSNIIDKLLDSDSDDCTMSEIFTWFYTNESDLIVLFPETIAFIRISICEAIIQVLKSIDITKEYKSHGFLTVFQLYLCKSLSEQIEQISLNNLEQIFLTIGLLIDLFKKTKGFCPELFNGLRRCLLYINNNFNKINDLELYVKWIILLINSMFILISNDINLDVLMKDSLKNLQEIQQKTSSDKMKKELLNIIEKIQAASKEAELKNHLNIVKEKAVIKIKQLTPRIVEDKKKLLPKEEMHSKGRIKVLKKQLKNNSKKIKKQLIGENVTNVQEKMLKDEHIVNNNSFFIS